MEKKKFCFILLLIAFLFWLWRPNKNNSVHSKIQQTEEININKNYNYKKECDKLFKKLRYPNQSLIMRPPPKMPPAELMNRFTQNGDMPITKEFYINEVYSDSNSNDKNKQAIVTATEFNGWLNKVKNNQPLNYGNIELQVIMKKY